MRAAVVHTFSEPPRYGEFTDPVATGEHEEVVDVLATGVHPRVRSQANGSHYTATDALPLIPGIDGVGRRADGSLVYFVLPDTAFGAMAERTVIDTRRSVALPADADPVLLAAAINPAMSSWLALRRRIDFQPGQSVLVLGATGSAGQLALQTSRHLGASAVIAAGRGAVRLEGLRALGATDVVDLGADPDTVAASLAAVAADVDVVLDYLWGPPAEAAIMPLLLARSDRSKAVDWIQIGSVAGADITLPSAALRQANLRFLGSGQGSLSAAGIIAGLPELISELGRGSFAIDTVVRPLAEVEAVWTGAGSGSGSGPGSAERVVLVP